MPKDQPKTKIYLDTSVPNFLFEDQHPEAKKATEELLNQVVQGIYLIHISPLVIEEIETTPSLTKKKALMKVLKSFRYITLELTSEVFNLGDRYVEAKIIPEKYRKDAIHLATATIYDVGIVVSWNFEHLVKVKTRREVNAINLKLGYRNLEIVSPFELVGYPGKG